MLRSALIIPKLLMHHAGAVLLGVCGFLAWRSARLDLLWCIWVAEALLFACWAPLLARSLSVRYAGTSDLHKQGGAAQVTHFVPSPLHLPLFWLISVFLSTSIIQAEWGALLLLATTLLTGGYIGWLGRRSESLLPYTTFGAHVPALELVSASSLGERRRVFNSTLTLLIFVLLARFVGFGLSATWALLWSVGGGASPLGGAPYLAPSNFFPGAGLMWIVLYCIWLAWMGRLPQHRMRYSLSAASDLERYVANSAEVHSTEGTQGGDSGQSNKPLDLRTLHNRAGVRLGDLMSVHPRQTL